MSEPDIVLAAPTYTYFPSYPAVDWEYTQTTSFSFISVYKDGFGNWKVKISTTNPLDTGYYQVNILAKEVLSGLSHTTSFYVRIICVRSITPSATILDSLYYIRDAKTNIPIPVLNLNPALCPNELVYTLAMFDASPLPAAITFVNTKGSEAVSIYETLPNKTGVFKVKVTATDPFTAVKTDLVFTITIKCTKYI